jgi:hypothetical protein
MGADAAGGESRRRNPWNDRPSPEDLVQAVADESNLVAHEGHKVEIKGRLEEGRPEQAGQPDTKRSSHEQAPRLRLEAIKMISSNCSR